MPEFFFPFRRKLGVLILIVACPFAALWVKSFGEPDYVGFNFSDSEIGILSQRGVFSFDVASRIIFIDVRSMDGEPLGAPFRDLTYAFPYWCLVTPLTLLSAWLLIGKPQSKSIRDRDTG